MELPTDFLSLGRRSVMYNVINCFYYDSKSGLFIFILEINKYINYK